MSAMTLALNVASLVGLMGMLVAFVLFWRKGTRPSLNPRNWFAFEQGKTVDDRTTHRLWQCGYGLFLTTQVTLWVLSQRGLVSATGASVTPDFLAPLLIIVGIAGLLGSLFFLKSQKVAPESAGVRGYFRTPGYTLVTNGVLFLALGLVALAAARL